MISKDNDCHDIIDTADSDITYKLNVNKLHCYITSVLLQ